MSSAEKQVYDLIFKVTQLTDEEKINWANYVNYIRSYNEQVLQNNINILEKEIKAIEDELKGLGEAMDLLIFQQNEIEKREAFLFDKLPKLDEKYKKLVQKYDLIIKKK